MKWQSPSAVVICPPCWTSWKLLSLCPSALSRGTDANTSAIVPTFQWGEKRKTAKGMIEVVFFGPIVDSSEIFTLNPLCWDCERIFGVWSPFDFRFWFGLLLFVFLCWHVCIELVISHGDSCGFSAHSAMGNVYFDFSTISELVYFVVDLVVPILNVALRSASA